MADTDRRGAGPGARGSTEGGAPDAASALRDRILRAAARSGADTVLIEPYPRSLRVRMRIDGALEELPGSPLPPADVVGQICALAGLGSSAEVEAPAHGWGRLARQPEPDPPEDAAMSGLFDLSLAPGDRRGFLVDVLPSPWGLRAVVRIAPPPGRRSLESLGVGAMLRGQLRRELRQPRGLVVIAGPPGAGKSATLQALLSSPDAASRDVSLATDQLTWSAPGVNALRTRSGQPLPEVVEILLRGEPDVLAIDAARDRESAEAALQAALTGRAVIATIEAPDAVGALIRLRLLGVSPELLDAALRLVVGQRLMRRSCAGCGIPVSPSAQALEALGLPPNSELTGVAPGPGCGECGGRGWRGQAALFEAIEVSGLMASALRAQADPASLRQVAASTALFSARGAALARLAEGAVGFDGALAALKPL